MVIKKSEGKKLVILSSFLILLSVYFDIPGENLVTSTISCTIKARKMEEVCKIGQKLCERIFGS